MVKNFNINVLKKNFKNFQIRPKHVEIILIVVTLIMGVIVVYLYKNKIETELKEKYENQQNNKNQKKLLLFYAPWCGASKAFLPTWDRLVKNLPTETYDVDLEENKQISDVFKIKYLPTLYVVNGENRIQYEGNRTYDEIVVFFNNN